MKIQRIQWVEVWIETASIPSSKDEGEVCLRVLQALDDGTIELIDPQGPRLVQVFTDYEEVHIFLRQEEYSLIRGRWSSD